MRMCTPLCWDVRPRLGKRHPTPEGSARATGGQRISDALIISSSHMAHDVVSSLDILA